MTREIPLNGETKKWIFRAVSTTASILILFLSTNIWNRVGAIETLARTMTDRLRVVEQKLLSPRFSSTDGLISNDCLLRGLKVAELFLDGVTPGKEVSIGDTELPVITSDISDCIAEIHALRQDLLRRERALIH